MGQTMAFKTIDQMHILIIRPRLHLDYLSIKALQSRPHLFAERQTYKYPLTYLHDEHSRKSKRAKYSRCISGAKNHHSSLVFSKP